jgi:hypothetical protein
MATLTAPIIGQAEHALRAILDRELARTGLGFPQWSALNLAGQEGDLAGRVSGALKVDRAVAAAAVDTLVEAKLLGPQGLTGEGRALLGELRAVVGGITARLYAGIPADDLETAGRVLLEITARANRELAG